MQQDPLLAESRARLRELLSVAAGGSVFTQHPAGHGTIARTASKTPYRPAQCLRQHEYPNGLTAQWVLLKGTSNNSLILTPQQQNARNDDAPIR
ncbi:hypothetical protein, partial [Pelomicrobium sp. G1]|uniref:hypothetical protein n=1 Tax=Pelomicrobium sp. G1 TaxID=3452920 RepID=UPI003F77509C